MPNPFENYTFEQANEAFGKLRIKLDKQISNRQFVEGDDWQSGAGWVGPQFDGDARISKDLKKAIEREFTSKGAIRASVRRHQRGVIGRIPNWQISSRNAPAETSTEPDETDNGLIGEAQIALNEFWKNSGVHQTLKESVTDFLSTGHAVLRLFFVQGADEGELAAAVSVEEAVKLLHLFKEEPEAGIVICDKETLKRASFFRYERDGSVFIEICYVNDDGQTVFKTLSRNDSKDFASNNLPTIGKYIEGLSEESNEILLPLNGKLLVFEMSGEAFITPAMRSQQKLVNKAYTMLSHNLDISGFRERVYLNAMPPGTVEIVKGEKKFVPDKDGIEVGAGKVSYTQGLEVVERDPEGKIKKTYTSPEVFESDPIPVTTYVDTVDAASAAILEEADQKHINITGDAVASGESRKEARECFKQSLEDTKSTLDDVLSEIFEAVLALVAYLMGKDDRYKDLQVTFSAILNPGPVSSEDRRVAREEADNGYRSRESAMEEIGIVDPDAMKAKIMQELEENPPPEPAPESEKN